MPSVLLVEDEPGLVLTITDLLQSEGYDVFSQTDGESGLRAARAGGFDLLLLDLMLSKKSGLDICRELRAAGMDVPILMLTAKSQLIDRVVGLKMGADDYMTKPFEPPELLARIEALLRRTHRRPGITVKTYKFADVEINFERAEVWRAGQPIAVAAKELDLLRYLIENRERLVPREEILREVWKYNPEVSSRTIDVHVAWLRQKLEAQPQLPAHIHTVRGKGYRFNP
jgi:two-component system alkaline phosphatase synthesis response regulator PhoP